MHVHVKMGVPVSMMQILQKARGNIFANVLKVSMENFVVKLGIGLPGLHGHPVMQNVLVARRLESEHVLDQDVHLSLNTEHSHVTLDLALMFGLTGHHGLSVIRSVTMV